jgi:hypothetical protein
MTGSKRYEWREVERYLGRADLFYLMVRLLRRPDANRDWVFERCREVQAEPDGCLDLWAREHFKSSVITFGLTIQDILRDPEITVGIFSHSRGIAKAFLRQIKHEFEVNEWLKHLYSDVLWAFPHKSSPRWSEDDGIIVRRQGNPKEATIEAWGLVDAQPTGRHFRLRVYDDVVTRESVTTPEMVKKTTDAWDLSQNLGMDGGAVRYIGTRYSLFDTYSEIIKRGAAKPRFHPATHNGRIDGHPVFLSQEAWSDKLRNSSRQIIASQQLQNPLADEAATFRMEWLRSYEVRPRVMNVYIMCDPSRGRSATSDNTAVAVIGVGVGGVKYLLDGACHRMTLSQRWQMLRGLYRKWKRTRGVQHIAVGYERYGAQSDDEYFAEQMELDQKNKVDDAHFVIQELNWPREGGESKRERVERLEPDFRNERFFLPREVWREGRPMTWTIDRDPESKTNGTVLWHEYNKGSDYQGLTRTQMRLIEGGSEDLVSQAIKRIDQDRRVYDVTCWFIEEYGSFPFGEWKDLIDATSRIYDMDAHPPTPLTAGALEPVEHWDR